ncbi:MAG TPA: hypothetical protein PKM41_13990 [Deltaproteobacteria bacterium]|jgi:hypothetical protein|nr:hypothetical protein [Deltaproteobacteria bacterium]HOI08338.1 hypothetical protein [Deltaproteobacteria bacterium]
MELLVRSSASFEEDLSAIDGHTRSALVDRLNGLLADCLCNREGFCSLLLSPEDLRLKHGLCSSLSLLPLEKGLSAILTLDEDPVFDQVVVTLIRLVQESDASKVFGEVLRSLHCDLIDEDREAERA